jgi:hypothetical protein
MARDVLRVVDALGSHGVDLSAASASVSARSQLSRFAPEVLQHHERHFGRAPEAAAKSTPAASTSCVSAVLWVVPVLTMCIRRTSQEDDRGDVAGSWLAPS